MRLIKMARVIMEISVRNVFVQGSCPGRILPGLLSARCQPLLQARKFLPQSVGIDLVAESQVRVEPAALDMFLHDVLPHVGEPAKARALVCADVQREVVA